MTDGFSFSETMRYFYSERQISALAGRTIGIAGAGGIGSNCAVMLTRSGFSRFIIADFDRVNASNLNRQAYTADQIGRLKVECLRENCRRINPAVAIEAVPERLTEANITTVFAPCDLLIEAFDTPESKALLFNAYLRSGIFLVGASGIAGYGGSDRISVRKVHEHCYIVGDGTTGVDPAHPPLAPMVTLAAAKMADIVLSHVLDTAAASG